MTELKNVARDVKVRSVRNDEPPPWGDPKWQGFGWTCSLSLHERRMVVPYWMGLGHVDKAGIPVRPKVLAKFFEIDLDKIETEKRAMLAIMRGEKPNG